MIDEIRLYIQCTYAAMGREVPADDEFALGVCMNWAHAGHVMPVKDWLDAMGYVDGAEVDEPYIGDEVLQFRLYDPHGGVRELRAPKWA